MIGVDIAWMDLVGGFVGFFLTIFVFSYLLGDNPLFRFAIYLFVGVSAGFVAAAAFYSVLWPQLLRPILAGSLDERLLVVIPLLLSLLLLAKAVPRLSLVGSPVMAFLVGIGAATIVGGAVLGTLFPQIQATWNLFDSQALVQSGSDPAVAMFNGGLVLFGVLTAFLSFQFSSRLFEKPAVRPFWTLVYWIGRFFIAIALGVIFAGVYAASLSILVERVQFLVEFIRSFLAP